MARLTSVDSLIAGIMTLIWAGVIPFQLHEAACRRADQEESAASTRPSRERGGIRRFPFCLAAVLIKKNTTIVPSAAAAVINKLWFLRLATSGRPSKKSEKSSGTRSRRS